ncbi:Rne/Rng family ribonuclease [Undibacterium oligocarboniphilum]|uniref:Ribonuclease E n=1 Tax=Undibacterium oligocarboniphilum TaxID=666702 RepID=A0A850QGF3_9BURK|nr:Rne/Rng family ribonuclease [Undibacterium oligocarboniphilum]MBC3870076.1 Rne/Rng family ribonuclease [Undibacterium oligocarboniphilum]NVO78067.1 Rne/Rng family ribonuclease [Undibacterium oligocarboniphilum]
MKRMLFNATQQEELRVAIVNGQKLIDIDIETAGRELRKSNIYKGVITRIEPSLEACFVNYGEERHGFLPFKEVARTYFKEGIDVRNASIKEALREGQEIMVQVEKEERGNKGAALTSFISLAGRYLVLMPNNPRGGGVSRRVEGEDRQELRETMDKLDLPSGMSVIARTAGIGRNVDELQWDLNYLMQLWRAIEGAGKSAPGAFLIYQESSLVIRAIRDYFQPDIGEILIDTDDIYEQAQQFMSHVMPDMVHRVKRYSDDVPLFSRFQIEHQIETAYSRTVPLPSGGAIVIDHTEALVSVDVNSARSTRGGDIESTAFNTNLEAAEEVARQLRLRDLGGLIVIDFIDMENAKNQREVETRLKDALRYDRARVQMGKISRFGLMELSRQRLRPSLSEGSHVTCPRCNGTGHIRDTESSALQVLRIIQEEAMKENSAAIHVQVPVDVAAFLLNEKRGEILKIETRHRVTVILIPNKHLETPHYKLDRLKNDDPRLEDHHASYAMAEQADTDIGYNKRQKEDVKPRQEAVVKSITPEQAPIVERKEPAPAVPPTPAAPGFFGKLFGFLFGKSEAAPAPSAEAEEKPAERERNGRNPRSNQRNRNRRNREDREDKPASARNDKAEVTKPAVAEQPSRPGKQAKQPREEREPRENKEAKEPAEGRRERQQRLREERKEVMLTEAKTEDKDSIQKHADPVPVQVMPDAAVQNQETGPDNELGEQGEERRRRRRRGGRNRNRREREAGEINEQGELPIDANGDTSLSPVFEPVAEIAENHVAPASVAQLDSQTELVAVTHITEVTTTTPVQTETASASQTAADTHVTVEVPPAVTPVVEAAVVSAPAVEPEQAAVTAAAIVDAVPAVHQEPASIPAQPVNVAPAVATPVTPEITAPVEVTTPAEVKAASTAALSTVMMPVDDLRQMLQAAGLELASTDPVKLRAAQENTGKIVPVQRIPRERKPLPPASSEPLVLVETRR